MPALTRVLAPERLDAPAHDPAVLRASLAQVAAVNRWLGGRRALRLALAPYRRPGLRVLDVGTGSADLPSALARDARLAGGAIGLVATDRHPQILAIAASQLVGWPNVPNRRGLRERGNDSAAAQDIRLTGAEATALPFATDSFDVVVLSLVLHHLDDGEARLALREAARVAPLVIVNELHRTRANYLGARLLALTLWRDNPLTSHDGPLSVLRAYRPGELRSLAGEAGLDVAELRRRWFQRLVLVAARPALQPGGPVPA
jgi:SAM-dependent methyltransferase